MQNDIKRRRRISFNSSTMVRTIAGIGQIEPEPHIDNPSNQPRDYQMPTRFKSAEENSEEFAHSQHLPNTVVHRQISDITEASNFEEWPATSTKMPINASGLLNNTSMGLPSAPCSQ